MFIGFKDLKVKQTSRIQRCFVIEIFGWRIKLFQRSVSS